MYGTHCLLMLPSRHCPGSNSLSHRSISHSSWNVMFITTYLPTVCMYVCVFSITYGCIPMSWSYVTFLGYGQLLVLHKSLTDLLVLAEIALCVIVLSEINDDDDDLRSPENRLAGADLRFLGPQLITGRNCRPCTWGSYVALCACLHPCSFRGTKLH